MYLNVQLLELERPVVVALNFMTNLGSGANIVDGRPPIVKPRRSRCADSAKTGENLDAACCTQPSGSAHSGMTVEPDALYDD
jgi:ferrous iron transport protein B